MSWWLIPLAIVGALLLALGVFVLLDAQHRLDEYRTHCAAADGHIYDPGGVSFCLTADGRFVEVYP